MDFCVVPMDSNGFLWNALYLTVSTSSCYFQRAHSGYSGKVCNANRPVHTTGSGLVPDWRKRRHTEESDQEARRRI